MPATRSISTPVKSRSADAAPKATCLRRSSWTGTWIILSNSTSGTRSSSHSMPSTSSTRRHKPERTRIWTSLRACRAQTTRSRQDSRARSTLGAQSGSSSKHQLTDNLRGGGNFPSPVCFLESSLCRGFAVRFLGFYCLRCCFQAFPHWLRHLPESWRPTIATGSKWKFPTSLRARSASNS